MAAYGPAIDRIRFLAGKSDKPTKGPVTITGNGSSIFSYNMMIAWREKLELVPVVQPDGRTFYRYTYADTWNFAPDGCSSATTNRHIRAARMALQDA